MRVGSTSLRRLRAIGIRHWHIRPPPEERVASGKDRTAKEPVLEAMPQPGARSSVPLAPSRQPRPDQELVPLQVPQRALANFVVHCGDDLELGQAHPAAELLRKIASALHADTGQLGFFRSPAAQPDLAGLANPVFWFGDQSPAPDGAYVLPSLKTMLDDPASKRRAWAVLKPWVGRLE